MEEVRLEGLTVVKVLNIHSMKTAVEGERQLVKLDRQPVLQLALPGFVHHYLTSVALEGLAALVLEVAVEQMMEEEVAPEGRVQKVQMMAVLELKFGVKEAALVLQLKAEAAFGMWERMVSCSQAVEVVSCQLEVVVLSLKLMTEADLH